MRLKLLGCFALVFVSLGLYGQNNKLNYCDQFKTAIEYIKDDNDINVWSIRPDSLLRNGWRYSAFSIDYVAFKLNLTKDEVIDNQSKEAIFLWQQIENNKSYYEGDKIVCKSLNTRKRRPNTILSKLDHETLLVDITTNRLGKEGSTGRTYLFFFESHKIIKVLESDWIE